MPTWYRREDEAVWVLAARFDLQGRHRCRHRSGQGKVQVYRSHHPPSSHRSGLLSDHRQLILVRVMVDITSENNLNTHRFRTYPTSSSAPGTTPIASYRARNPATMARARRPADDPTRQSRPWQGHDRRHSMIQTS